MKRGQSLVEYTLLVAVALIGLLLTANSFFQGSGSVKDSFSRHFETVKGRITGN